MDSERIISEVFCRPALWNKKHKCYHNRAYVEKLWMAVAKEMKVSKEDLKKKWKGLRDQFRTELRKFPLPPSGDTGSHVTSSWHSFKSLLFLKDQIRCKKISANLKVKTQEAIAQFQEDNDDICNTSEMENTDNMSESFECIPEQSAKSKCTATTSAQLLEIERRKLDLLERKTQSTTKPALDEDEAFFLTLLPHIRKLQPQNKFLCRMEIQNVLYKHVYGKIQTMTPQRANECTAYATGSSPISIVSDRNNVQYSIEQSVSFEPIHIENMKCESL